MNRPFRRAHLSDDPVWYKDAIIYELRVRSFSDSNGDGIGDFRGLTEKLDYLQDLGVSALWLLPICPSPGRDDGYDISDYTDVHPDIGDLRDVRRFVKEAHRRDLRVITELVCNHTSDQHPWFARARRAPKGSALRDFYVWSDRNDLYRDARIIFKDFEPSNWSWDPVAKSYFWHRFFSHQPDLNFENPAVQKALLEVVDFWFGLGVDGLRLDAVPYLFEEEGTNCENLPRTHAFLKTLRAHVDARFKNRMLLAEANQWPEDAAQYFGDGDECHMNFHFPIMPRIFMSIHMEDRLPIIDILAQTPQLNPSCQWALFLRNHDELTLEMVTDEERDYMYRAYAHEPAMRINLGIRRRLAPLVGNNRRNIELMNGLLCSLPGTPVLYYGDEIGMGDNVFLGDRNGVRTPMQWSADRNAGFSRANPQRLILPIIIDPEYHYESLNVEAQQNNGNSLLWWMKRLIALRSRFQAFGRGSIEFLNPENAKVLAFIRQYEGETVLVVANLARAVQYVELNLAKFKGRVPIELFGRTEFPPIGELPYLLTLGGHAFYWFSIEEPRSAGHNAREAAYQPPILEVAAQWSEIGSVRGRELAAQVLPAFIEGRRWFAAEGRELSRARVTDSVPLSDDPQGPRAALVRMEFTEGEPETALLPIGLEPEPRASEIRARSPQAVVAELRPRPDSPTSLLYDVLADPPGSAVLLEAMRANVRLRSGGLELRGFLDPSVPPAGPGLEPRQLKVEHRNVAIAFGETVLLRVFRRLGEGMGPELEIGRFLAARAAQGHPAPVAPLVGALELRSGYGEPITLATATRFVRNEGTAWRYARGELKRFYERALTRRGEAPPALPIEPLIQRTEMTPPPLAHEMMGGFLAAARLLGLRLAELHRVLAMGDGDPAFTAEPYSALDMRSVYQTKRNLTGKVTRLLRHRLPRFNAPMAQSAERFLAREAQLYKKFEPMLERRFTALRGRFHGHFHLENALYTGKDFVIVDFEGDHARPLPERRRKRSPLRDVIAMVRSFDYAASIALLDESVVREVDRAAAEPWARLWLTWAPAAFVGGYLGASQGSPFVPRDAAELHVQFETLLLEKALEELLYDLTVRPDLSFIPLRSLNYILSANEAR
ncbi:MAG: maltose alpha-D-glucosyltransferase [Myxococcales bacterium]